MNKIRGRYSRTPVTELIILEPEDWTPDEWKTLCKVCGSLPADRTQRMVLHIAEMETYVVPALEGQMEIELDV